MKAIKPDRHLSIALLLINVFAILISNAQQTTYNDDLNGNGFSIQNQSINGLEINHTISSFHFSKTLINGEAFDAIKLPGPYLPNEEGNPDLPIVNCYIAIPNGATVSFEITGMKTEKFSEIDLAPAPQIPLQSESGPMLYSKNMDVYAKNAFYPQETVLLSEITQIRGVDAVILAISPFQYNPVSKELFVYHDINLEIDFKGGKGQFGEERLRNRWWDPILAQMLLNFASLPEIDNENRISNISKETGAEYLIISPNGAEFQQWADSINKFRTTQGILSKVVTLEEIGGNTASEIENYINNAYFTWDIPPTAILLLGDDGTDPNYSVIAPIWQNYCVSDNVYADVDGDELPDMIIARMCAQNASELETMVTKFLEYERNPPTDPNFYNHPITSCSFNLASWNQLITEPVAGFYEVIFGKNTNRINVGPDPIPEEWSTAPNSDVVIDYFGPDGLGYIPATPGEVNCSWNSTAQDFVDGINDGAFILLHNGPSSEQGWIEPNFTNSHIDALNNTDPTFIWSIDGLTGKFNISGECFAEKFHRHSSGALGIVAASEVSYAFLHPIYAWGAFDNMWPDFLPDVVPTINSNGVLPAFANAAGKYHLLYSTWPINPTNKEVAYNIFHYFGDAFSTVYTEIPQELSVSHDSSIQQEATIFEVTANEGALIGLSVDEELIGAAEGTGEPVEILIQPQTQAGQMLVTVTKQNYFRYENTVPIFGTTGYNEQHNTDEILIYPNPSQGKFSIWCNKSSRTVNITILNAMSKIVFKASKMKVRNNIFTLDLKGQSKGVYYIIIYSESGRSMRKVIIQ